MTVWDDMPAPDDAAASGPRQMPVRPDGSCYLHRDHGEAPPLYLDGHYILPESWQRHLWGEVLDQRLADLCQTGRAVVTQIQGRLWRALCHGAKGGDLQAVIGPATRKWFRHEVDLAEEGLQRYMVAAAAKAEGRAHGPRSKAPEAWRCGRCGGGMVLIKDTWSHRCVSIPLLKRIPQEGSESDGD